MKVAFGKWSGEYHAKFTNELFQRDFMWYNEKENINEWFYALPAGETDAGGFEIVDLPLGLYAVASCNDADIDRAEDWLATRQELIDYANNSPIFKPYDNAEGKPERYPMFHITSPFRYAEKGISQENLYYPIDER